MSKERIMLMRLFGAEVILTPAEDGMSGAIAKADMLAEKNPNVVLLRQFENPANPEAHKLGTGIEIFEDTGGEVDAVVIAVGTSGTLNGVASTLKSYNPDLYVAAVEPKKQCGFDRRRQRYSQNSWGSAPDLCRCFMMLRWLMKFLTLPMKLRRLWPENVRRQRGCRSEFLPARRFCRSGTRPAGRDERQDDCCCSA